MSQTSGWTVQQGQPSCNFFELKSCLLLPLINISSPKSTVTFQSLMEDDQTNYNTIHTPDAASITPQPDVYGLDAGASPVPPPDATSQASTIPEQRKAVVSVLVYLMRQSYVCTLIVMMVSECVMMEFYPCYLLMDSVYVELLYINYIYFLMKHSAHSQIMVEKVPKFSPESLCLLQGMATSTII